jgi:hypothetical protein
METSGNKESHANQHGADPAYHRSAVAAGEIAQICLMSVHYDQHPDDREANRQAD